MKSHSKFFAIALMVALVAVACSDDDPSTGADVRCEGKVGQPGSGNWMISSDGVDRTFVVYPPGSYDATRGYPVVVDFHGFSSNAFEQEFLDQMPSKADQAEFVLVYPQGLGGDSDTGWNAGLCCGYPSANGVDDVAFVSAMLDELERELCIDPSRIYVTGMSNGGFFAYRLACELSERIAAIAPVAGGIALPSCNPSRAVPLMHFHGTSDALVPYNGGNGLSSVPDTVAGWAESNGCAPTTTTSFQNGDSACESYTGCPDGQDVTLCTVEGGGHTWPGGTSIPQIGYTTQDMSANDNMWEFFSSHRLPL